MQTGKPMMRWWEARRLRGRSQNSRRGMMWLDTLGKWKSGCWVVFARGMTLPSGTWWRTVGPVVMC
jgi:hypothetical protein